MTTKNSSSTKLKSLSFFSGAMGMDLGLEEAGIEAILACEVDKASRKTIKHNNPNIPLLDDICNYTPSDILDIIGNQEFHLITGGPPCQAFSTAGKRKGFDDDRGNVFLRFINLIIELKPQYALIENVRGLLSAPFNIKGTNDPKDIIAGGALLHIISMLENAGYGVSFNLYNSANYGSPQKRERVILVCSKDGDTLPFIPPTHSEDSEYGLQEWNTFKDSVRNLNLNEDEHEFINFSQKRLKYYSKLKPGENWKNLPDDLQKEAMGKSYYSGGGKTGFYRRLAWDKPAPTLVTSPAMPATSLAHPEKNRPISVQEYKRIQEFPDEWKIEGSVTDKYRQIGNAVPLGLARAAGKLIIDHFDKSAIKCYPSFKYSRYRNTDHVSWTKNLLETNPDINQLELEY